METPNTVQKRITGSSASMAPLLLKSKSHCEMAVLEDPHHGPVAGQQRQDVHDHGLDRQDHAAQQQEQHERGDADHEQDDPGKALVQDVHEVVDGHGGTADEDGHALRRRLS